MSRKTLRAAVVGLLLLALAALLGASSLAAEWPPVKPTMVGVQCSNIADGTIAGFAITIENGSSSNLWNMEIQAEIPEGTKVIATWPMGATVGADFVGWMHTDIVGPGKTQGPFMFAVSTDGEPVSSQAWVRFFTATENGEAVSPTVTAEEMTCADDGSP